MGDARKPRKPPRRADRWPGVAGARPGADTVPVPCAQMLDVFIYLLVGGFMAGLALWVAILIGCLAIHFMLAIKGL